MTATMTRRRFTAEEHRRLASFGMTLTPGHHFTLEEYELLHMVGILAEDERVELIHGEIFEMMTTGRRHERCVNQLTLRFARAIPDGLFVGVQNPVRIPDDSAPQPDIAIIRDHGPDSPPITAADALLVLEVSDSTLAYDRDEKMPLYAGADISEAWIVDVNAGVVTRYTEPRDGQYQRMETARVGETLPSTAVPGLTISVADTLR